MIVPMDTSAEAFALQARLVRRLGTDERLRRALEVCDEMRELCLEGVRRRHPEFDEAAVRREFARIVTELGPLYG